MLACMHVHWADFKFSEEVHERMAVVRSLDIEEAGSSKLFINHAWSQAAQYEKAVPVNSAHISHSKPFNQALIYMAAQLWD